MTQLIVAVSAAILLSGMCSLFEAVLYSVPTSHIERLAHEGKAPGRILQRLRRDVDRPIAAILSLNTVANTAGAAVAGAAAATVFGAERLVYFSAAFTLGILILSEVLPKTAGVVYSRPLASVVARPLQVLVWIMTPFVWICRAATRLVPKREAHSVSEEELIVMARLGMQAGTIESDELDVIENILQLGSKKARDVMTPRSVMVALGHQVPVEEARAQPRVLDHSRIPVFESTPDDVVGIVHRRDILTSAADGRGDTTVGELMTPVHFVSNVAPLDRILRMLIDQRQHLLVVIDEHGGVAGVITLEDVLEEILGKEIMDEFDEVADLREIAHRRRKELLDRNRPS